MAVPILLTKRKSKYDIPLLYKEDGYWHIEPNCQIK